jgi:hypothetical protein
MDSQDIKNPELDTEPVELSQEELDRVGGGRIGSGGSGAPAE